MRAEQVRSPDGARWRVRRRWLDRPLPDVRSRFREYREENSGEGVLDGFWVVDFGDSVWAGVALTIAIALVVIVLLPLIGVALELILVVLVLGSGLLGRLLLRRPWTVEAENLDDSDRSTSYAVKGWRRSGRAATEIAATIEAGGAPERIAEGIRLRSARRRGA
jgi:hypothetical protein